MKSIPLTTGLYAYCSDEDYKDLMRTRWYPSKDKRGKVYAKSKAHGYMHRYLMKPSKGQVVDHVNGNGLDNTRENLRVCTQAENSRNMEGRGGSSRFKGVSWVTSRQRWVARLVVNGKAYQKVCKTELEAMEAYNELAKKHHGEFAHLNYLEGDDHDQLPENLPDGTRSAG